MSKITRQLKISIIEDDPFYIKETRRLISSTSFAGCGISADTNLNDGIKTITAIQPDLILLDLFLPDSKGLATVKKVHAQFEKVPVIVFSGLDDKEVAMKAIKEGAQDYLIKGIYNEQLLERSILYTIERHKILMEKEQLKEKYRLQSKVLKKVMDPVMVVNEKGKVTYVNKLAEKLFKCYQNKEIPEILRKEKDSLQPINGEWCGSRNGQKIWLDIKTSKFVRNNKHGYISVSRDITERKSAEQSLRKQERFYRSILENVSDIIAITTLEAKVKYVSPSVNEVFGFKPEELEGNEYLFLIHPEDKRFIHQSIKEILKSPDKPVSKEIRIKDKKGDWRHVQSIVINKVNDVNIHGILSITRDITNKIKMENELQQSQEEFNTFVYRASHDLKSPISSLMGLINLSRNELKEHSKTEKYLNYMEKSTHNLDNILLNLSGIAEIQGKEPNEQSIDFKFLVNEVIEDLKRSNETKNIDIQTEIEDNIQFVSDEKILYFILKSLIDNSIKYMKKGISNSYIKIEIIKEKNWLTIKVEDNGQGIKHELQHRVFDMFYRGNEGSTGNGLGLYLVKKGVKKLKGSVRMNSHYKKGSEFILYLPSEY